MNEITLFENRISRYAPEEIIKISIYSPRWARYDTHQQEENLINEISDCETPSVFWQAGDHFHGVVEASQLEYIKQVVGRWEGEVFSLGPAEPDVYYDDNDFRLYVLDDHGGELIVFEVD